MGTSQLRVEGIIFEGGGGSYAIVNGEIVKEKDVFAGYEITKIEPNRVTFRDKEDKVFEVVLNPDEVMIQQYLKQLEQKRTPAQKIPEMKELKPSEFPANSSDSGLENLAELTRQKLRESVPPSAVEPAEAETGTEKP